MPTYNFTSDLRISVLPERIKTAATEIINNELSIDKSASNNRATLAFYFNLVEETNTLKLAANGYITEVIRNFVLKFQFPNTYTADIFNKNIEDHTLIAPLREIVKLLAYQYLVDGNQNPYLTYDEIKFFVFGNPDHFKSATADDYKCVLYKINNNRSNGHDYTTEIGRLLNWKQYERQSRELISIIPYACDSFKTSNGKLFLSIPNPLSEKFADVLHFIASVMKEDTMWMPKDKVYNQATKNSYVEYMDINGDVELCRQAYPTNDSVFKSIFDEPLQTIYYGAPGTGKSHKIDNDPHVTDENTIRTTFHPDSDYSTFVGAYKPTMAPMPVNAFVGTTVHHAKNADNERAYEKKIVYKYVPQAFLKAYVAAWRDLDNPHFLVIEEINRGNCAQIFGDLFQLLDRNNAGSSSYAIHADEDITQFLAEDKNGFANLSEEQKNAIRSFVLIKDSGKAEAIGDAILSGKKLLLPPNLYIWATMNTSDQSLFPIDSAFKRRWNWEYMPIDYDAMDWQFEAGGKRYLWSDFLKKMNPLIYNLTQSSDKQMGYFFAKADKKTDDALTENNLISEKIFLNKVLFYLWTDVLKDFEAGDKIFRDEEKGQMYQFSDFFPTTNGKLAEFVGKLELPEVGDSVSDNSSVDDEDDTSGNNTKSSKDQSRYSVNGVGTLKKGPAAVEAMRLYVQNNPDATAADIVSAWKIQGFPLVESEESFASRLAKSNDDRLEKRTELINLANGESIRIFKGFNPQSQGWRMRFNSNSVKNSPDYVK